MKRIIFSMIIALFFPLYTMNSLEENACIWIKTQDEHIIKVNQAITQQSNLLMVLQEKYSATQESPIPIPFNKILFDFFCLYITHPAKKLVKELTLADYSQLMDIATILKCPIFYTQLIEQIFPTKELYYKFLSALNLKKARKKIAHYSLQKECLKKSYYDFVVPQIIVSKDEKYFVETISNDPLTAHINLWRTNPLQHIKTFNTYTRAIFNPCSTFLILYFKCRRGNECLTNTPLFYSITHDTSIPLLPNYKKYSYYKPIICHNGQYILQQLHEYIGHAVKNILIKYSHDTGTLEKISDDLPFKYDDAIFLPDNQHILAINNQNQLMVYSINNSLNRYALLPEKGYSLIKNIEIFSHKDLYAFVIIKNQEPSLIVLEQDPKTHKFLPAIKEMDQKKDGSDFKIIFSQKKKIFAYSSDNKNLQICDFHGNVIASYKSDYTLYNILFDPTGNYLIALHSSPTKNDLPLKSSLLFWNISNVFHRISGIKINTAYINDISFTPDGLLLTGGYKTQLWEMNGDEYMSLGKSLYNTRFTTNFLLTSQYNKKNIYYNAATNLHTPVKTVTKLLYIKKSDFEKFELIKQSLSLSEILLLNDPSPQQLFPHMPDTRTYKSLQKKLIPKNQLIFQ